MLKVSTDAAKCKYPCKFSFCHFVVFVSGKEVDVLMQALNSLATPEEKLAALCKKYADLVSSVCECLHFNSQTLIL